ncbi:migration and invasion enhancer 1 isoform X1 [Sturnira hondurensis]|uniref:migration and invasion enhancer 1 isoform X1 n=1 Tax=Sturnira hondurensis TaxID=192404 RepID=UPI00187953EA|nr:migration and invasion enhancer 1 isoform X1 [Sturnira hondurensis]
MSGDVGSTAADPHPGEVQPGSGVHLIVEFCEPCGFEAAYLELESAVKEQYPGIEIESRTGGPVSCNILHRVKCPDNLTPHPKVGVGGPQVNPAENPESRGKSERLWEYRSGREGALH